MHKHELIASAARLAPPTHGAAQALEAAAGVCAADLNAVLSGRPDLFELIGPDNLPLMESNHTNHFNYLASLAALYDPVSFVEIVIWVFRTYRAHGFSVEYWPVMLPESKAAVLRHLTADDASRITPIHDWLLAHIPDFVALSDGEQSIFETMSRLGEVHAR